MVYLSKLVLRRPVSTFLAVLSLVFFGFIAFTTMKMELLPDMNFPYMIVATTYPGAAPEDVDELISKPIEEEVSVLPNVQEVQSRSMENVSMVVVRYQYGTNMDRAYDKLKKKFEGLKSTLPEQAEEPTYMEFDLNSQSGMVLAVSDKTKPNLYNYVKNAIEPEMEKLTSVASVSLSGGQAQYVRVELSEEKLLQYHLNMDSIINMIKASDFTYPAGSTSYGEQKLSLSVSEEYSTVQALRKRPGREEQYRAIQRRGHGESRLKENTGRVRHRDEQGCEACSFRTGKEESQSVRAYRAGQCGQHSLFPF